MCQEWWKLVNLDRLDGSILWSHMAQHLTDCHHNVNCNMTHSSWTDIRLPRRGILLQLVHSVMSSLLSLIVDHFLVVLQELENGFYLDGDSGRSHGDAIK